MSDPYMPMKENSVICGSVPVIERYGFGVTMITKSG